MSFIPFIKEKSYSLLIGVGKRAEEPTDAMMVSAQDAVNLKKALLEFLFFREENIQLLVNEDATQTGIKADLDQLVEKTSLAPADLIIVFFSGHGYTHNGKYFLVCNDTRTGNVEETALEATYFFDCLKKINCDKMLVFFDCCHAAGMADQNLRAPFEEDLQSKNRVVLTACHKTQLSYLSRPVSIFTYALIEGLGGKFLKPGDTKVTLFNLAMDVRERVIALSAQDSIGYAPPQQPQLNVVKGSSTEDFPIAVYPKGGPQEITVFDEAFMALRTENGKELLQLEVESKPDTDYRKTFQWIQIKNINTGTINAQGNVHIGDNITNVFMGNGAAIPAGASTNEEEVFDKNRVPVKRQIEKKHRKASFENRNTKKFIITINSNDDIKLSHADTASRKELEDLGILQADESISDLLCENTITYCYETIRWSGENLKPTTRNNLSAFIGSYLFKILLKNKQGVQLINSIVENEKKAEQDKEDIQLILNFGDSDEADKLSFWPWEYFFYQNEAKKNDRYFLHSKIKIHRVARKEKPLLSAAEKKFEKMKVLVFFTPNKNEYKDEHITAIADLFEKINSQFGDVTSKSGQLLEKGNFEYRFLYAPKKSEKKEILTTYSIFNRTVNTYKPNIIHFIGEAQLDEEDTELLYFWNKQGNETVTQGIRLTDEFYPDMNEFQRNDPGMKLFILQSWNNAADIAYKAFKKISGQLIESGWSSVLSIPSGFNIEGTNSFADYLDSLKSFYEILAEEYSLDNAVFEFRKMLVKAGKGYPVAYFRDFNSDDFKIQVAATNDNMGGRTQLSKSAATDTQDDNASKEPDRSSTTPGLIFEKKQTNTIIGNQKT